MYGTKVTKEKRDKFADHSYIENNHNIKVPINAFGFLVYI